MYGGPSRPADDLVEPHDTLDAVQAACFTGLTEIQEDAANTICDEL